jgi:ribosomal protein S18 acetylase RimI-like enzyme
MDSSMNLCQAQTFTMITAPSLEIISPKNALIFKAIRLHALQDSPLAFGSTYAKESQLSDADWLKRAEDWSSNRSVGYLAFDREISCGIVAAFLNKHDSRKAHVVSMWVHPARRQSGVGRVLIEAIQKWAKTREAHSLLLTVTNNNYNAIEFYKRNGFTMTGRTEPYPNDPSLFEYEMSLSIWSKA